MSNRYDSLIKIIEKSIFKEYFSESITYTGSSDKYTYSKSSHNIAAVIVDMQIPYLYEVNSSEIKTILAAHIKLINYIAKNNIPVAIVNYTQALGISPILEDEMKKVPDDRKKVINKTRNDGFYQTKLNKQLREWGAEELIITGLHASFCVKGTAESALANNYSLLTAQPLLANKKGRKIDFENDIQNFYKKKGTHFDTLEELFGHINTKLLK